MAKLEGLVLVEWRKIRGGSVGSVGAVGEDLEQTVMRSMIGRLLESPYLCRLKKFGEDVSVGIGGGLRDEVGGGAG